MSCFLCPDFFICDWMANVGNRKSYSTSRLSLPSSCAYMKGEYSAFRTVESSTIG